MADARDPNRRLGADDASGAKSRHAPVVGVVLLAAGASSRLPGPKQLLRHEGTTLLRRAAEAAVAARCGPVVVVLPAGAAPMRAELAGLEVRIVENSDAPKGLSTSVRAGLDALDAAAASAGRSGSGADAALFMTCDQPLVTAQVLGKLVAAYAAGRPRAVACEYAGTVGVPALFDRSLFGELRALAGDRGAKGVLERHLPEAVRVPFEGGSLDIDTPSDADSLI